jgi:hypothetical protein
MGGRVSLAKRLEAIAASMDEHFAYDAHAAHVSADPEWLALIDRFVTLRGMTPKKYFRETPIEAVTDEDAELLGDMLRLEAAIRARPVAPSVPFILRG